MELIITGSYTDSIGKSGIRVFRWANNALIPVSEADCPSPSFMVYNKGFLYVISELPDTGVISAYTLHAKDGTLQFLNKITVPCRGLCHIDISPDGKMLCAAAYNSGHVLICDILPDGRIGKLCDIVAHKGQSIHQRQSSAHAHQALVDKSGLICVSDLGLDKVLFYEITPDHRLSLQNSIIVPPGEGPRHVVIHPSLPIIYVLTELGNKVLCYEKTYVEYHLKQTIALNTKNIDTAASAELELSKDGRFLYASVRGLDCIALMKVNELDGLLSDPQFFLTPGKEPRMFSLSSNGDFLFVALQNSSRMAVMKIDKKTGVLVDTHIGADILNVCYVQEICSCATEHKSHQIVHSLS